jgi:pantoate--beta-alanine ligase
LLTHNNWHPLKIFKTRSEITQYLEEQKKAGKSIGFIPTMGALHKGHLSLISEAGKLSDCVVCSIFVNPTQFNDPSDLAKYPRPILKDIELLQQTNCDVLFNPEVSEIYPEPQNWHIDLGELENILEGKFRPGHYQGVTQIVYKLFMIVKPDYAFFGQKDYQQCMIIQKMIDQLSLPVKLVINPIIRDEDGLAMSSRNIHLSESERAHALILSQTLTELKNKFDLNQMEDLIQNAKANINKEPYIELDYLEIVNSENLHTDNIAEETPLIALIAAKAGKTRLIDNIIIRQPK